MAYLVAVRVAFFLVLWTAWGLAALIVFGIEPIRSLIRSAERRHTRGR